MIRSDSRDSKNRVRSSDAHSTSGTLGRRNKGGMWEDPQQRMIQEQLDSMRDDEIIELKNKPNKTPKDEERYDPMRYFLKVSILKGFLRTSFFGRLNEVVSRPPWAIA